MQTVALICLQTSQIIMLLLFFLNNASKNKTWCSFVDANMSVHTHCLCVLHALLEMIRELKMHIQFVSVMLFPAVVFHIIVF